LAADSAAQATLPASSRVQRIKRPGEAETVMATDPSELAEAPKGNVGV
jgi:hypothetical protein